MPNLASAVKSEAGRPGPHLAREVPHARQEQVGGVAQGLHALDVVAGVPPAAGGVDPDPQRREVAGEAPAAVHVGRLVGHRVLVVQVRRRGPQGVRDEVRAVPLGLVEGQGVGQRLGIHVRADVDPEARRGCGDRPGDRDRVAARGRDGVEVERVDVGVGRAPRAEVGPDLTREHGLAARVPHAEAGAGLGDARHQVGTLGRGRGVADLVHPHERRARRGGRQCSPSMEAPSRQDEGDEERAPAASGRHDPVPVHRSHHAAASLGRCEADKQLLVKFPNC